MLCSSDTGLVILTGVSLLIGVVVIVQVQFSCLVMSDRL